MKHKIVCSIVSYMISASEISFTFISDQYIHQNSTIDDLNYFVSAFSFWIYRLSAYLHTGVHADNQGSIK